MNQYSLCPGQKTGRTGYFKRRHGKIQILSWMCLVLCLMLPVKVQATEPAVTDQAGILTEEEVEAYESGPQEDTRRAADGQGDQRSITDTELKIAAVAALIAGGITACNIIIKYRLRFGGYRYPVEKNGSLKLRIREDRLVNQFVRKRDISK